LFTGQLAASFAPSIMVRNTPGQTRIAAPVFIAQGTARHHGVAVDHKRFARALCNKARASSSLSFPA
jgi:hypothetical protein